MLTISNHADAVRSEMSSNDLTTIAVHRALHEGLNSIREARNLLEGGEATPDQEDMTQLAHMLTSLTEALTAVNASLTAKAVRR